MLLLVIGISTDGSWPIENIQIRTHRDQKKRMHNTRRRLIHIRNFVRLKYTEVRGHSIALKIFLKKKKVSKSEM